jgi:hypothetical protein
MRLVLHSGTDASTATQRTGAIGKHSDERGGRVSLEVRVI